MAFEKEPIRIEILDEEVVHKPEERGADGAQRLEAGVQRAAAGAQKAAETARAAWNSEQRRETQARLARGARRGAQQGARVSRSGLARGLSWLSARLAGLAERFTPLE